MLGLGKGRVGKKLGLENRLGLLKVRVRKKLGLEKR